MLSPATHSAEDVVRRLQLAPIPHEGGWFRRVAAAAPACCHETDATAPLAWTSIFALFTPDQFSALHRLASDEVWCFHAGDPLESLRLHPDGRGEWITLGLDVTRDHRVQDTVRAEVWQGTRLVSGGRWALVSCIVVPGFRWEDFALADAATLVRAYPEWSEGIRGLTRGE